MKPLVRNSSSRASIRSNSSKFRPPSNPSDSSKPGSAIRRVLSGSNRRCADSNLGDSPVRYGIGQRRQNSGAVIQDLETKLENALKDSALFKDRITQQLERHSTIEKELVERYEFALHERDRQLDEYAKLIAQLQSEVLQASSYIKQRDEHEKELRDLQNQFKEVETRHEKELLNLKFEAIDRKIKLFAMEKVMREEFHHVVEQRLQKLMEERHKGLIEHNATLQREKLDMSRDMERLLSMTSAMGGELTTLQRSMKLHRNVQDEVLKHSVIRIRQQRSKEAKLQRLESKVRELQAQLQEVHEKVASQYKDCIHSLEEELKATQNTLKTHRTELQNMRQYAAQVVGQRSDLEKFFYMALEDCRRYQTGMTAILSAQKNHLSSSTESSRGSTKTSRQLTQVSDTPMPPLATPSCHAADRVHPSPARHSPFSMNHPARVDESTKLFGMTVLPELSRTPPDRATSRLTNGGGGVQGDDKAQTVPAAPTASPPPMGAYIEEMSWQDKEKVIKALLFYINSTFYSTQSQRTN
ncbi:unnamed protein product [Phytomonas sp. EM1]|nr:unnamed protein product [Phytomonas sp. EM1]|eukprot:CCW62626.1 unnamed protein product [Phytomonas sp. isolate EM1]